MWIRSTFGISGNLKIIPVGFLTAIVILHNRKSGIGCHCSVFPPIKFEQTTHLPSILIFEHKISFLCYNKPLLVDAINKRQPGMDRTGKPMSKGRSKTPPPPPPSPALVPLQNTPAFKEATLLVNELSASWSRVSIKPFGPYSCNDWNILGSACNDSEDSRLLTLLHSIPCVNGQTRSCWRHGRGNQCGTQNSDRFGIFF